MNLINFLVGNVCETLAPVMTIIGIVVFVIKIAVPVILIVIGMVSLAKAIMSQDDKKVKDATSGLVKKVLIGLGVYLVITVVSLLMQFIGFEDQEWKDCAGCVFNPFDEGTCYIISPEDENMNEQ